MISRRTSKDVAVGLILNRRDLLLSIPSGRLRGSEAITATVRIQEQVAKATSALRRAGRMGQTGSLVQRASGSLVKPSRRQYQDDEQEQAGDVPAETADEANGGEA